MYLAGSVLFGHEKGSFTGAVRRHPGFFKRADGGTLFPDELTEMPIELQAHLLRVLETSKVLSVGSDKESVIDARIVAATNRDPELAIADDVLRQDLFFGSMSSRSFFLPCHAVIVAAQSFYPKLPEPWRRGHHSGRAQRNTQHEQRE